MSAILDDSPSAQAVTMFKCLAEEHRLRILNLLDQKPLCVCHIEQILGIGAVRTSQQLGYLKRHGLVQVRVRGTWRIYSISPSVSPDFAAILATLRSSLFTHHPYQADRDRVAFIPSCS